MPVGRCRIDGSAALRPRRFGGGECQDRCTDGHIRAADGRSSGRGGHPGSVGGAEPGAERAAREALRAQVGPARVRAVGVVAGRFPHISSVCGRSATARRGPHAAFAGRARASSRSPRVACSRGPAAEFATRRGRARRTRAAGADEGGAGQLQVHAPAGRRSRRTRLRCLARAPAPRPNRDARRLVAAEALLRLSVSQGAAHCAAPAPATHRPSSAGSRSRRPTESIAASVRRWRSVIEPTVLVSDIGTSARNLRQRFSPQRR